MLDPGHGGHEAGGLSPRPDVTEKDVNLAVVHDLRRRLVQAGASVRLTREGDEHVSLAARVDCAVEFGADAFVSVHHNATAWGDRDINQSEVYYMVGREGGPSQRLAQLVGAEMDGALGLGRIVRPAFAYYVLRKNPLPAVIGEASFISNPEEAERLLAPERIEAEAEAYFRALAAWSEAYAEGIPAEPTPPPDAAVDWARSKDDLFRNRKVLLDPDGGYEPGDDAEYADATLEVSQRLAERLRGQGGEVCLTRQPSETVDESERVRRVFGFAPDVTIIVSYDRRPCPFAEREDSCKGYARWEEGQRLASHLAEGCARVLGTSAEALPGSDWMAMHGAPTFAACRVSPRPWSPGAHPDADAGALLSGLADYLQARAFESR